MNKLAPVPKLIRIYLSIKKIGEDYFEARYKDFYPDGTVAAYGCEDFSGERLRSQTKRYEVRVYNGQIMHGARYEGRKMTSFANDIRVSAKSSGLAAAKILYKNAARVQRIR